MPTSPPRFSSLDASPGGPLRRPEALGLTRSFGFGDRLGLALPGHLAAARRYAVAPVFAQIVPRELDRNGRPPGEMLSATARDVAAAHIARPWGADANGVKTEADVEAMAAAGFTWFTLDPSAFIENRADTLAPAQLAEELAVLGKEGILPAPWLTQCAGRHFDLPDGTRLTPDPGAMARAAAKFSRALHHAQRLARHLALHGRPGPVDLELALVECASETTPVEHLFVALDARRRGLALTALALRWDAGIEPASDFVGDVARFERSMRVHAAIARHFGPYKVSLHHGGDKFTLLPALARACGEALHVKTAGTSFLAAMRVLCRTAPDLFSEIASYARVRFEAERVPALVATTRSDIDAVFRGPAMRSLESGILDTRAGRQMLETTAGSILRSGLTSRGRPFREAIVEVLLHRRDDHMALLDALFTRHLELLNAG